MLTAVKDFVYAALPWVVTGICIAIMAVRWKQVQVQQAIAEKEGKEGEHQGQALAKGAALGLALGALAGIIGIVPSSYGIAFGLLIGITAGIALDR